MPVISLILAQFPTWFGFSSLVLIQFLPWFLLQFLDSHSGCDPISGPIPCDSNSVPRIAGPARSDYQPCFELYPEAPLSRRSFFPAPL